MNRIIVIGGNGSGKSTFSKQLAAVSHLPLVHLDRLLWHGHWQTRTREEFDALLDAELQKDRWIIDGNYNRTIPKRLSYCDTIFYFDFSTLRCLWGVTKRVLTNYGKSRDDMGGYCPERFDLSFYKAILQFNKAHRKHYHAMMQEAREQGKTVVIFHNRRQVKRYLNTLR
ncbi:MAG: topology modulation protein [Clostridia bacterium]|nr:topology modulation protein [Clostridia bacterium]